MKAEDRRRDRATQGILQTFAFVDSLTPDSKRCAEIREAINDYLKPKCDAEKIDFAVRCIEFLINFKPRSKRPPPSNTDGADKLERLAAALLEVRRITQTLNGPAFEAINAAKAERNLTWRSTNTLLDRNEINDFLDEYYPLMQETIKDAAKHLRRKVHASRPKGRDEFALEFTKLLTHIYKLMTNKLAPKNRSETAFSAFVSRMFEIAGINLQGTHYAYLAAEQVRMIPLAPAD